MPSDYMKKMMKERGSEMKSREEDKAKQMHSETMSAGKTYQESTVRKTEAGKYDDDMLRGLGYAQDKKIHEALKKAGAN